MNTTQLINRLKKKFGLDLIDRQLSFKFNEKDVIINIKLPPNKENVIELDATININNIKDNIQIGFNNDNPYKFLKQLEHYLK